MRKTPKNSGGDALETALSAHSPVLPRLRQAHERVRERFVSASSCEPLGA